ncbi:MAG: Gfo/Idh/MocA family oxidoreductase [Candidatus Hydrogenedentes bacterium]|nr:Gfo/Idh/MocA family oxidoreductase [Candidatus Hydrogenedentota bacterium]
MITVGAIDIDTSHPKAFAPFMKASGRARYTGVYNSGFRSDAYVAKFMEEHEVPKRYDSLDDLARNVDIGFIHSCNWDKHISLAKPFVDAGKPVFIDKPIVGSLRDCMQLLEWEKAGAVVLGSSSVRYAREIQAFMAKPLDERGAILSIFGTSGVDEFNYGVHVVEGIGGFLPGGAFSVQCVQIGAVEQYHVTYRTGETALYQLHTGAWLPFVFCVTTTKNVFSLPVDAGGLYAALLDRIFDFMESGAPLASTASLIESVKICLAGKTSRERGNAVIKLEDLRLDDPGYDGAAFERGYAIQNA